MNISTMLMLLCLVKAASRGISLQPFQKYCPSSVHCTVEDTIGGNITKSDVGECCGSCSCDPNCGQTLSCCFKEDNVKYTRQHGKECVEPFVGDRNMVPDVEIRGIMMVTQCLDQNVQCKFIDGQINIAIVEGQNSEIFLNDECAKCNNVKTFKRWGIKIILTSKTFQLDSFRNLGERNSTSHVSEGATVFLPISTSKPTTCNKYFFQSVNYSSCPNESFKELCASVLLPYSASSVVSRVDYRNVFCYLCEHSNLDPCFPNYEKSVTGSFSLILNYTISTDAVGAYFSRKEIYTKECDGNFLPHPYKVFECCKSPFHKVK